MPDKPSFDPPEQPDPAFGKIVVVTTDDKARDQLIAELRRQVALWQDDRTIDVMAVPVVVADRPVAAFVLYHRHLGHFRRGDATTLSRLAVLAGGLWGGGAGLQPVADGRARQEIRAAARAALIGSARLSEEEAAGELVRTAAALFDGAAVRPDGDAGKREIEAEAAILFREFVADTAAGQRVIDAERLVEPETAEARRAATVGAIIDMAVRLAGEQDAAEAVACDAAARRVAAAQAGPGR